MPASFLDTLDAEARELLLSVASPVSFVPGAVLVRHGEAARGAYILREGSVEAVVTLPGGESLTVATLGPGSVFGEMALIELGTCTATVRAAGPVDGWFVAHEEFRALVSRAQPSALRLQHAVTVVLAAKLAALNTQMLACSAPEDRPARALSAAEPLATVPRTRKPGFAAGEFLPRLPVFEKCSAGEIDDIVARAAYLEVPRAHGVFTAGSPSSAAFVVVRGAVEIVSMREGRERRVAIVGPGQLVGYLSVLRRAPHSTHAFAREGQHLAGVHRRRFPRDLLRRLARLDAPAPRGPGEPPDLDGSHQPRAHAPALAGKARGRSAGRAGARGRLPLAAGDSVAALK
jgi:CRP-like cAMP-binding protein